jgi:hypothetical protein
MSVGKSSGTGPGLFPFFVDVQENGGADADTGGIAIADHGTAHALGYGLAYVRGDGKATARGNSGEPAIAIICGALGAAATGDYGLAVAGLPAERVVPAKHDPPREASTCERGIAIAGRCGHAYTNWGGIAIAGKYGMAMVQYFHHDVPLALGVIAILGHEDDAAVTHYPRWHVAIVSPDPSAPVHGDAWYKLDWTWDAGGQPVLDFKFVSDSLHPPTAAQCDCP